MPNPPQRRIQIICDTSIAHFRDIILGARHYAYKVGNTTLSSSWLLPTKDNLELMMKHSPVHGIIAQITNGQLENALLKLRVPVVCITNSLPQNRFPTVVPDDLQVGRVAAAHLIARHCTAYACWGQAGANYSSHRMEGFRDELAQEGLACATIESPSLLKASGFDVMWQMRAWLQHQSRPLGVFTVLDTYGSLLLQTAKSLGWRVPEDIAILSVGNDEFWCDLEEIPLSSVNLPSYSVGYEAARLLDDLITGRETGSPTRHPQGVVYEVTPRKSTDIIFVKDQAVARATLFIRDNATKNIYVEDVVRASGISRVALQKRFKDAIGRSMLEDIRRVRIEHAKNLLRTTDTKLDGIAELCSFSSSQRFCMTFRKHTGQSPGQYRRSVRKSSN